MAANSSDLLGLFATAPAAAKPAAGLLAAPAAADPFDLLGAPPKGISAASHGAQFDRWWEDLGGSPKVTASAPKTLTPQKSKLRLGLPPRAPAPMAATAAAGADVTFADFDKPAAPAAAPLVTAARSSAGAATTKASAPDEWHAHDDDDDEAEEAADEDVDELSHDLDLFGIPTGARARRASSVVARVRTASNAAPPAAAAAAAAAAKPAARPGSGGGSAAAEPPPVAVAASAVPGRRGSNATAPRPVLSIAPTAASADSAADAVAAGTGLKRDSDSHEGPLWLRVSTAFVLKRWRERWAVLRAGILSVWPDRAALMRGDEPSETLALNAHMALSTMKVNAGSAAEGGRLFYRHIAQLDPGSALTTGAAAHVPAADEDDGLSKRIFKFGSDSQVAFEQWTRALRAAIEAVQTRERDRAATSLAMADATNASDLFRHAIASPRERPRRRYSGAAGTAGGGAHVNVAIYLLDDSVHHVTVAAGATVKDTLVALRRQLGLRADADFSLDLRARGAGDASRDAFACLPDVMGIEAAAALAAAAAPGSGGSGSRALVYKRRMYMPPLTGAEAEAVAVARSRTSSVAEGAAAAGGDAAAAHSRTTVLGSGGGGVYGAELPAADLPDVDAEALAATGPGDAAHMLLFIEAVYYVTRGYYLLPLADAVILAGLLIISKHGRASAVDIAAAAAAPPAEPPSRHALELYRLELSTVMAAQSIAEHKATSGKPVEDLLASIRREHLRLSQSLDAFAAQRVYIKRVKQLPEYGGAFFFATYQRLFADNNGDPKGSRAAPETPAWAEALTTDDVHSASAPAPLPVLVCMNAVGTHIRPLPPWATPSTAFAYAAATPVAAGGSKAAAALSHELTASETISTDGKPVPWALHPIHYIEIWGVKKTRPAFTYRVRERQLRIVELTSHSYKEMASTLHMCVFALLAQREGRAKRAARAEASDYGGLAAATKAAARDAQDEALASGLPHGWSVIQDPITGQTAYWNQVTKDTVFSRPTA